MTSPSVVVLGEALVDLIVDGESTTAVPGGSAANVALGLARRRVPVQLSTYLAHDDYGDLITDFLTHEGVALSGDSFEAPRTSTALARREPSGNVSYEFDVGWYPRRLDLPDSARCLHLGSFPAFSELETDLVSALAGFRSRGWTSFDPNIRPALIGDRVEAGIRFARLCSAVDLLKLSDEDAAYLAPGRTMDDVLDTALETGVRLAVVTSGSDGLTLATSRDRVHVPASSVAVVDTIGAGDTIMTSLIVDAVESRPFADRESLRCFGERAAAAAAITVARAGADLPHSADLANSRYRNVCANPSDSLDIHSELS